MWDAIRARLEAELGEPVTIDALTGGWRLAQREKGHRHSVDDVLTADFAAELAPDARGLVDLGSGIGGVGLLALWRLPNASLIAIEAQEISFTLLQANIEGNGLADRVTAIHGDLRETDLELSADLITGSPPYFPVGTGIIPEDSQKAHARFELRGGVEAYCAAAANLMHERSTFCFCMPTPQRERSLAAIRAAQLVPTRTRDVIPRAKREPLFTLFAAQRAGTLVEDPPFTVRDSDGNVTAAMEAVRTRSGF